MALLFATVAAGGVLPATGTRAHTIGFKNTKLLAGAFACVAAGEDSFTRHGALVCLGSNIFCTFGYDLMSATGYNLGNKLLADNCREILGLPARKDLFVVPAEKDTVWVMNRHTAFPDAAVAADVGASMIATLEWPRARFQTSRGGMKRVRVTFAKTRMATFKAFVAS
jgi:hypothetical protein